MIPTIEAGLTGTSSRAVGDADLATALGSGTVEVYGTPAMIATLIVCSFIFYFFFDFYNAEFVSNPTAATAPTH